MKDADGIEDKIPNHHSKGYCNEDGPAGGRQAGDRGEGWRDRADAGSVYPKKYLDELRSEINEAKAKIAAGEQPVFDTVDALFEALDGADE